MIKAILSPETKIEVINLIRARISAELKNREVKIDRTACDVHHVLGLSKNELDLLISVSNDLHSIAESNTEFLELCIDILGKDNTLILAFFTCVRYMDERINKKVSDTGYN